MNTEQKLQMLIKSKMKDKKRIVWNASDICEYFHFAQDKVKELKLKSVAEYCYYLNNNFTLPNRKCRCGKIKTFYTLYSPYKQFCSKKCIIKFSSQSDDEEALMKYIKDKNNNIDYASNFMSKYKDLITKNSKMFESKSEYITYLFNNKSLPNSICKCGKKKPYRFPKSPYREFCSTKCANKDKMTADVKEKIASSALKTYQSFSSDKKRKMVDNQKASFLANWTDEDSKRYSDILKLRYQSNEYRLQNKLRFSQYSSDKQKAIISKIRKTNEKLGRWITEAEVKNFKDYARLVWRYTNKNNLSVLENIEKRGRSTNDYHLDHKYSIFQGFKDNIPAKIIGNICNLEMLKSGQNLSKNKKCSISKEELLTSFEK